VSFDENKRIVTWSKSYDFAKDPISIRVQFDGDLQAQSETWIIPFERPQHQQDVERLKRQLRMREQQFGTHRKIALTRSGCSGAKKKELKSEGKRAKFGSRRLKGNNHQDRTVHYADDGDPMKSVLSTTLHQKGDRDALILRWETVAGMDLAESKYIPQVVPRLLSKSRSLNGLGMNFYEVSTIQEYLQWEAHPAFAKNSVYCKEGVVTKFMGRAVSNFESFEEIYKTHYLEAKLDKLVVPLSVKRNVPPFAEEELSLAVDSKKASEIKARQMALAKKIEAEDRAKKLAVEKEKLAREQEEKARQLAIETKLKKAAQARQQKLDSLREKAMEEVLKAFHSDKEQGPYRALGMLKFIQQNKPAILSKHQRQILRQVGFTQKSFIAETLPMKAHPVLATGYRFAKRFPIPETTKNGDYYLISIAKGELVLFERGPDLTKYRRLDRENRKNRGLPPLTADEERKETHFVTPIDNATRLVKLIFASANRHVPISATDHYIICPFGQAKFYGEFNEHCQSTHKNLVDYNTVGRVKERPHKRFVPQHIKDQNFRNIRDAALFTFAVGILASSKKSERPGSNDSNLFDLLTNTGKGQSANGLRIKLGTMIGSKKELTSSYSGNKKGYRQQYRTSNGRTFSFIHHYGNAKSGSINPQAEGWKISSTSALSISASSGKTFKTLQALQQHVEECIAKKVAR